MSSEYNKCLQEYNKHKNDNWEDWLNFDMCFKTTGKQGIAGILKSNNKNKYIFKLSQYINYFINHEYIIMKSLSKINKFCPHFPNTYGIINCNVDSVNSRTRNNRDITNPFLIEHKYPIKKEVLLLEYIPDSIKFTNYIGSDKFNNNTIFQISKQVLCAITMAQIFNKFTHYDLHSNNIMIKRIEYDNVNLYIIDEKTQICVPTLGYNPIIIDFGFSYCSELEKGYLWPSLAHTEAGFISIEYDWVSDLKLFLVTLSYDLVKMKKSKESKRFRKMIKEIYKPLNIDLESGWDTIFTKSITDYLSKKINNYEHKSILFDKYYFYCIDIIQTLIKLPLHKYSYLNMKVTFTAFINEFIKIEKQIGNHFHNLYILKNIVDYARENRSSYINETMRESTVIKFKKYIYEIIDKISKYCKLDNINWELLLCSLYELSKNIEGYFYYKRNKLKSIRDKYYKELKFKSSVDIIKKIEKEFPNKYEFNNKTVLNIYNLKDRTMEKIDNLHPDTIYMLNTIKTEYQGELIYKLIKEKKI